MQRFVLAIGLALAATTTSYAQLSFEHQRRQDPYRNLFSPEAERLKAATAAALRTKQAAMKPCVAHPMRVVPANPDIDAKIRVAPPTDLDHKIKTVPLPTCKPE